MDENSYIRAGLLGPNVELHKTSDCTKLSWKYIQIGCGFLIYVCNVEHEL